MKLTMENVQIKVKEYTEMRLVQLIRRDEAVRAIQNFQAQLTQIERNIIELDGALSVLTQFEQPQLVEE